MIIYKQAQAGECGNYAFLYALQKLGTSITEQEILSLGSFMGFLGAKNRLQRAGYIKDIVALISEKQIALWLKKGHYLPVKIPMNNFESVRNPPHIQDFKGKFGHFVCIVDIVGDTYKVIDQQGENFADNGYWHIKKEDLKKVQVVRIVK